MESSQARRRHRRALAAIAIAGAEFALSMAVSAASCALMIQRSQPPRMWSRATRNRVAAVALFRGELRLASYYLAGSGTCDRLVPTTTGWRAYFTNESIAAKEDSGGVTTSVSGGYLDVPVGRRLGFGRAIAFGISHYCACAFGSCLLGFALVLEGEASQSLIL